MTVEIGKNKGISNFVDISRGLPPEESIRLLQSEEADSEEGLLNTHPEDRPVNAGHEGEEEYRGTR